MQTVVLTGGGRGLGRGTAEKFAARGYRVVLVACTPDRASAAEGEIRAVVGDVVVESRAVDLASMGAVRRFAAELGSDLDRIDVLFHIAGVLQTSPTRRLSVDGYEETFAVNALAPFLLTRLLLPLPARGAVSRPRRSVIRPPARRSPRAADHVAAVQPGQPVTVSSHAARRMHRLARRGRWADRPPHGGRIYRRTAGQAGETLRSRRRSRHARHGRGGDRRCP